MLSFRGHRVFLSLLVTAVLGLGGAEVARAAAKPWPNVNEVKGQPYTMIWDDGREAVLKVSRVDSDLIASSFQVTESTCSNRQNITCSYSFVFRRVFAAMVWTKNPDSSRLGKIVELGHQYDPNMPPNYWSKLDAQEIFTAGMLAANDPKHLGFGLPPHEIKCEDFSWLPGGDKAAPPALRVLRWDGEDNVKNPETEVNENRTVGGAFDVDLVRVGPQTLRITAVKDLNGIMGIIDILNFEPTLSMTFQRSGGEICQVGTSSNTLPTVIALLGKLEERRPDTAVEKPYIVGSDGTLENDNFKSFANYWVSKNEKAVYR